MEFWDMLRSNGVLLSIAFFVVMAAFIIVVDYEKAAAEAKGRELATIELLLDPHFKEGFGLLSPEAGVKKGVDILTFGKTNTNPAWLMAQWHSQYCLSGSEPRELFPGAIGYENAGKLVAVAPPGSEYADLILKVNGEPSLTIRL